MQVSNSKPYEEICTGVHTWAIIKASIIVPKSTFNCLHDLKENALIFVINLYYWANNV